MTSHVVVTGAAGFIGRNLVAALRRQQDLSLSLITRGSTEQDVRAAVAGADTVVHLAGVNRPQDELDFERVNIKFTRELLQSARAAERPPAFVFASSSQAVGDSPYGRSKREAESLLQEYGQQTGAAAGIFRLPGVFGKWSRPNYNSVVATFCHNTARDLALEVHQPEREITLVYVDDVVEEFLRWMLQPRSGFQQVTPVYTASLQRLAKLVRAFRSSREDLQIPDFSDDLVRKLYATYLSYLPESEFAYALTRRADARGELAEVLKSRQAGQIFVSRTRPGVTRGNHFHDTKVEKFCVIEGDAVIRFRHIERSDVIEYKVSGVEFRVVDIPPGYTHSIENVGEREMIVLFWASEIFDPSRPDTYGSNVIG